MTDPTSGAPPSSQTIERAADFTVRYANNIYFESTAWDIKLTFGHIEQAIDPVVVKHDFAVTIPWPQAKLALFWLRLHVEMAEAEVGVKIPIRKDVLPAELPEEFPEPLNKDVSAAKRFREIYEKLRREFLATL
ncbi:MAG: hypothetical protein WAU33_04645 [Candidatus Binataceae bacterium]|jgi:hypothetical protein